MSAAFIKRATHVNIFQLKIEIFPKHGEEEERTGNGEERRERTERIEEQQPRDSPASQTWPEVDVDVDAAADADVGCGCHTGHSGASAAPPAATRLLSLALPAFLSLFLSLLFSAALSPCLFLLPCLSFSFSRK